MLAACDTGPLLDLSPPEHCWNLSRVNPWIPFDSLVTGLASDNRAGLRMEWLVPPHNRSAPPWPYRRPLDRNDLMPPPVTLADVAIGMSISASTVTLPSHRCAGAAPALLTVQDEDQMADAACSVNKRAPPECMNGLACARATWMRAAPQLEVLLLVDCAPLCAARAAQANATGDSLPEECRGDPKLRQPCTLCEPQSYDGFPRPEWLRPREGVAKVHFYCYYGPRLSVQTLMYGMDLKVRTLLRALVTTLAHKRFYLKLDTDAMLQPRNLLRFLAYLGAHVHPSMPLYFGTSGTTHWIPSCYNINNSVSCHTFRFGTSKATRNVRGNKASAQPLRESKAYARLFRRMQGTVQPHAATLAPSVRYAAGGAYGLSNAALLALNRSDCIKHVHELECDSGPCLRSSIHRAEDANVGLCMHLLSVRLIEHQCFMESSLSGHRYEDERLLWSLLTNVQMMGSTPPRSIKETACRTPITMHPLKHTFLFRDWWRLLEGRAGSMLPVAARS